MNIHNISTSHSQSVASALLSKIRAKQSPAFSIEAHLPQPPSRQKSAAAPQVRQSDVTPSPSVQTTLAAATPVALNTTPLPTILASSNNPTTMWTPGGGFLNNGDPIGPVQNPQPLPFMVTNSNYNPADPSSPAMIQDPIATAAPQAVQWTSSNGMTTTGVMNPFGLTQNNPALGFFGGQG